MFFLAASASMYVNKLESSSVLVKMHPEELIWDIDRGLFEQLTNTFFPQENIAGRNLPSSANIIY